jgi:pimeloyl-ACP methyl ester carboxylesterase
MTTPIAAAPRTLDFADGLTLTIAEQGSGRPVLLLHGGAGPQSMAGFAAALAPEAHAITPVHPGFAGAPRPDWFDSITDLAVAYLDLLDRLDLRDVTIIGNSIGGWIAAEMALRDADRIGRLVLLNAVGIRVDESGADEIVDTYALAPDEIGRLSFHNPALRPDPAALSPEQRAAMAANQQALAVYARDPYMHDPELRRQLRRVHIPVLVAWGEQDGIVGADYGRAYAQSFPNGSFHLISDAGHFPQIEQPEHVLDLVRQFTLG